MSKSSFRFWLSGTTAAAILMLSLPLAAGAADIDEVEDKLERVERDLRDLQYEVYKGNPPASSGGVGGPPGGVGTGGARLNDVEQSLRELRGQVETLSFQVRQLTEQVEIARKESNYRLGALEGGAPAGSVPMGAPPAGPAPKPTSLTASNNQPPALKTGTLGTLPAAAAQSDVEGGPSPRQQYDAAMDLLSRAQYVEAQGAFRGFVAANPADELAGPAQYWVGDIAFTQKDYQGAARAFADVLKRYSKTARAPDAMLKLGLSLLELGQKKEGCTTLGAIKSKYPSANKAIFDRASRRAAEAKC